MPSSSMTSNVPEKAKPLDWPRDFHEAFSAAELHLTAAQQAMQKLREEQKTKHVRANRQEAVHDALLMAERDFVALQRSIGFSQDVEPVAPERISSSLQKAAIESAQWLMLVGLRLGFPSGVWLHVVRGLLPLPFDSVPKVPKPFKSE
eukprot:TRINITY_DN18534_c1_g1_i1.p1 TRINITY_DN18534_c1_g1~~TRINITY_DN18534_c1_g1_i1.p1  ORF type:complete len:148 (+),score=31.03 TRINITY_DN18534_c1_g1_i1:33-476(+)